MPEVYLLEQAEKDIFSKIHGKRWDLYDSTGVTSRHEAEKSLRAGPVQKLVCERKYVLMPKIEDSRNPESLFNELERVARDILNKRMAIKISGRTFDWTGFIPHGDRVKVNTNVGHYLSYSEFVSALDSISQI
jgi:hypothetical protein